MWAIAACNSVAVLAGSPIFRASITALRVVAWILRAQSVTLGRVFRVALWLFVDQVEQRRWEAIAGYSADRRNGFESCDVILVKMYI